MTLLRAEMEELAEVLQDAEPGAGYVLYDGGHFGAADYWDQPRVFERLAGTMVRQADEGCCVFGARAVMLETDAGAMFRPPGKGPEGDEFEGLWLLAVDLTEGVEIGLVRRTLNGWGELRICADQVQLTPEAPGYWLMQELLREES